MTSLTINYNSMIENPILNIISMFNAAILTLWVMFALYHAASYGGTLSLGLVVIPAINLLLIGAFTEKLTISSGKTITHTKTIFYLFKKEKNIVAFKFKNEKRYSALFVKSEKSFYQTGMLFEKEVADLWEQAMIKNVCL